MVIELDPVPPFCSQGVLTGGLAEFHAAAARWESQHLGCGRDDDFPLSVATSGPDAAGLFVVVFGCVCGQWRAVFGWLDPDDDSRPSCPPVH